MVSCKINDIQHNYPSSWDELTRVHLVFIINHFKSGIEETELWLKAMLCMISAKVLKKDSVVEDETVYHQVKIGKSNFWLSSGQMKAMSDKLGFLTTQAKNEIDQDVYTLNSELTINLFDSFKHHRRMYHGPSEKLFNLTFGEYITAETNFLRYLQTKDPADLDKLVATLYRQKTKGISPESVEYNGDLREAFNDHLVDARAIKLKKLDEVIKLGVLLYYQGCRKFIIKQFPDVFKKAESARKSGVPGLLGLVDALSGDDVTKTEEVRTSLLYDVLVRLQKAFENNEKHKEEIEKLKRKNGKV